MTHEETMVPEETPQLMVGTPSKDPRTKPVKPARKEAVPDDATAWVVAFSAFLINFIMAGLSRMSGILYVAFIDMFHTDRKGASMPFSVRSSTMNLLGPVVGILGQKYGVRIVSISGGILGTFSAAACFFVEDITWITVLWGGLNGAGTALVTTLTTVVVSQYFDEYRTTAAGLSFSGACIGSFIFPPLIEYLLHAYGLDGSFLIVAAIIAHTIPAAMILRKPIWVKIANRKAKDVEFDGLNEKDKSGLEIKFNSNESFSNKVDLDYLRKNSDVVVKLLTAGLTEAKVDTSNFCPPNDEILKEMEEVYTIVDKQNTVTKSDIPAKIRVQLKCETSPVSSRSCSFRTPLRESLWAENRSPSHGVQSPLTRAQLLNKTNEQNKCKPFIITKLNELNNKTESQIMASFSEQSLYKKVLHELKKLHKVHDAVKKPNIFRNMKPSPLFKKRTAAVAVQKNKKNLQSDGILENIFNSIKLHKNPLFLLVSLCRAVHFTTFIPVVTIIVDYGIDKGFLEEDGIYIIAALSVGDLLGRLCLGWVTDRGFISMPKYMLIVMILQGFITGLLPFMNSLLTFLPTVAVYAMLQGSVFVRHPVLLGNYLKPSEQSLGSGCVNFFAGIAGFAVPSYVGYFRDTIGSYDGIFYINGIIGALAGLIWVFEPCFVKLTSAERETADTVNSNEPKV